MVASKMNDLFNMIWIELRKVYRSRVPFFTLAASLIMPLGIALLIFLARNPALSQKLGLVSAKANLVAYSAADWSTYMGFTSQIMATGGFFLFTFAISWVFGREFADGTLKDMLAVPVSRSTILLAKFIVVAAWAAVLAAVILVASLAMGFAINLPLISIGAVLPGSSQAVVTALLAMAGVLPFALFASLGRGYLLPVGIAILALILANLVTVLGLGEFFPWAVAGLYAQGSNSLPPASYWIVILTALLGMAATDLWWKYADQNR